MIPIYLYAKGKNGEKTQLKKTKKVLKEEERKKKR